MSPTIFISYRREDAIGHAGRLFDRLVEQFGREHVFRDIDTLAAGDDFVEVVRKKINDSDVLLALIGPRWLTAADQEGRWRLADENDPVRVEIAAALKSNIRVIPVLVQGAIMPKAKDLPGALAPLAQRNAVEIRDKGFDQDVAQLVEALWPTWRHKLIRVFARRPVYAALLALGAVLVGLWVYPHATLTPDQARIRIVQMGLRYDANTFVEMAKKDDEQAVNLFLRAGMAPDAKDSGGGTALMWAAQEGHLGLAKSLIEKGADPSAALPVAAGWGHREILNLLLGSQDAIDYALVRAAGMRQSEIARTLIDLGADVNFVTERKKETALSAAAGALDVETVRLLLSSGANPNGSDKSDIPLNQAIWISGARGESRAEQAQSEIVQALLEKGADVNRRGRYVNDTYSPPLLVAIEENHPQIALLLLERGADVNAQSVHPFVNRNMSALMWAANKGLTDVVKTLLAKGAVVKARDEDGFTALFAAARGDNDQPEIVRALIAAGADVDARTVKGRTPLMLTRGDNFKIAEALLVSGVNVNAADQEGWTALMFAADRDWPDMARFLLNRGADIAATNKEW